MSSISLWVTDSRGVSRSENTAQHTRAGHAPSSTILNLLDLILSENIFLYDQGQLDDNASQAGGIARPPTAGSGGHATVKVGKMQSGETVAIKSSRKSAFSGNSEFIRSSDNYLQHLILETQILSHKRLKHHRHVVDIFGLAIDDSTTPASLSIVLQWSSLGNLCSFLRNKGEHLSADEKIELACGVARGLQALHEVHVCHGDVKTQNTLVFIENEELIAKVSDFGESVVATRNEPTGMVRHPPGTPLLSAPELRRSHGRNASFHIKEAIKTDVFSFGLLLWEVLRNGRSYLESSWLAASDESKVDVEAKESFLERLPPDALLEYCLRFILDLRLDPRDSSRVAQTIRGCIRDNPNDRSLTAEIVRRLSQRSEDEVFGGQQNNNDMQPVIAWTCQQTLIQLLDKHQSVYGSRTRPRLPRALQHSMVEELRAVATDSMVSREGRAQAAMILSECHAIAFGTENNDAEVFQWIRLAATEGHEFAYMWSERIHEAIHRDDSPSSGNSKEQYLSRIISRTVADSVERCKEVFDSDQLADADAEINVTLLNNSFVDTIEPLHLAALTGDSVLVARLLLTASPELLTAYGFNAAHYACLGGQLSTLTLILEHGTSPSCIGAYNITPLHFATFFKSENTVAAVQLLLEHGARTDTRSSPVNNVNFNMMLEGVPLDWAVETRNRLLVQALLPHTEKHAGVQFAFYFFYWEIAEDILHHQSASNTPLKLSPPFNTFRIKRSQLFLYWIAHGREGPEAIRRTIKCAHDYGLLKSGDALGRATSAKHSQDGHHIVESILHFCSSSEVKSTTERCNQPLMLAMMQAPRDSAWRPVIEMIAEHYTVQELQSHTIRNQLSYLQFAVCIDSTVAAQVFLSKGVDANQRARGEPALQLTPLEICAMAGASTEMWSILLENGADINAETGGFTPLERLLIMKGTVEPDLLPIILRRLEAEGTNSKTLHRLVNVELIAGSGIRSRFAGLVQWALSDRSSAKHINTPDEHGVRMLERAVFYQRLDLVEVLLEANADASIPIATLDGTPILPLHIVCFMSELLHIEPKGLNTPMDRVEAELSRPDEDMQRRMWWNLLNVAMELIDWHLNIAQSTRLFEGITKLHIAYYMHAPDLVEELIAMGSDESAKGVWPGINGKVMPRELPHTDRAQKEKEVVRGLVSNLTIDEKRWQAVRRIAQSTTYRFGGTEHTP